MLLSTREMIGWGFLARAGVLCYGLTVGYFRGEDLKRSIAFGRVSKGAIGPWDGSRFLVWLRNDEKRAAGDGLLLLNSHVVGC